MSDADAPRPTREPPASFDAKSVDERLEALMETIRTWDWRAAPLAVSPSEVDDRTLTASSALATTANAEAHGDSKPPNNDPMVSPEADPSEASDANPLVSAAASAATAAAVADVDPDLPAPVVEPAAQVVAAAAVPVVVSVADAATDTIAPVVEPVAIDAPAGAHAADIQTIMRAPAIDSVTADPSIAATGSADAIPPIKPDPKPRAESRRGPGSRVWSHRWTKVALVCLGAVLVAALVVWIIRFAHEDQGSSGPILQPSSTTTTGATSPTSGSTAFVEPITSAELAQYEGYAAGLEAANKTARKEFRAGGNSATVAQLSPSVTAYLTAVNLYGFQLHFIQWPASLQGAVASDQAQIAALMNVLQSFSTVTSAGASAWLSDLRTQANALQLTDNHLRQGLGLPGLSDYP